MKFHKYIFLGFLVLVSGPSYSSECSDNLRQIVLARLGRDAELVKHEIKRLDWLRSESIDESKQEKVETLSKKFGGKKVDSDRFIDFINEVYLAIRSKGQSLSSAEKMAKFGEALRSIYKEEGKETVIALDTAIGLAVARLESFTAQDFKKSNDWFLAKAYNGKVVNFKEYKKWVSSYIQDEGPYKNLEASNGVLSAEDYRDIVIHNLWPVFMKDHDIRHVHFAVSHPKVLGVFFEVARSKNSKRYFMMSSLFEGVDTIQYYHERKICTYFDQKGYTLQEAMLFLGRATDAELDKVVQEADITSDVQGGVENMKNYRPKFGGEYKNLGDSDRKYNSEIDDMMEDFHTYSDQDSDVKMDKVLHYTQTPKETTETVSSAESERIRHN